MFIPKKKKEKQKKKKEKKEEDGWWLVNATELAYYAAPHSKVNRHVNDTSWTPGVICSIAELPLQFSKMFNLASYGDS